MPFSCSFKFNANGFILCASSLAIIHILLRTFAPGLPRGKGRMFDRDRAILFSALEGANHPWVCFLGNRKSSTPSTGVIHHIETHDVESRQKLEDSISRLEGTSGLWAQRRLKSLKKEQAMLDDAPIFYDVRFEPESRGATLIEPAMAGSSELAEGEAAIADLQELGKL